jgi:hypothetical protein
MNSKILFTLSIGRRASNLTVSNAIPKYCKHVTGPTVLYAAIGILSLLHSKLSQLNQASGLDIV